MERRYLAIALPCRSSCTSSKNVQNATSSSIAPSVSLGSSSVSLRGSVYSITSCTLPLVIVGRV